MMAWASLWLSLACLILSMGMLFYRPMMTDLVMTIDLWGCCLAMCFAGLLLFSYRKVKSPEPAIILQRLQCRLAFLISIAAAVIVYYLVARAQPISK